MKAALCRWGRGALLGSLGLLALPAQSETVHFDGTLVEDACEVFPGDENIVLDFGNVVSKYLYLNTRTRSQPFQIRLSQCDLALGNAVKLRFTGVENPALPGLLALDTRSEARGVAIGLEAQDGTPIRLNDEAGYVQALHSGDGNTLNLQAYVQAEPAALSGNTIVTGSFMATATFNLEYE